MTEINPKPTIGQLSIDARILADKLADVPVGVEISYAELSRELGRNVQDNRGVLTSARRVVLREKGAVFGVVHGVGLRRLADDEVVMSAQDTVRRIGRAARRKSREIANAVNYGALGNDARVKHNTSLSLLGALGALTRRDAQRRLEGAVADATERLPLQRTLDALTRQRAAAE